MYKRLQNSHYVAKKEASESASGINSSDIDELKKSLADAKDAIAGLSSEIDRLKAENAALDAKNIELCKEIDSAHEALESIQQNEEPPISPDLIEEVAHLRTENDTLKGDIETLKSENRALKAANTRLKNEKAKADNPATDADTAEA